MVWMPSGGQEESRAFRVGGVSYLRIPAEDPRRSAAFYEAVFGWSVRADRKDPSFEDGTGHVIGHFVADLPVAIFINIELQAFQFYHVLIWHVVNGNGGKIGKARPGTEAGELGYLQVYDVVSLGVSIGPYFQLASLYLV